MRLRNCSFEPQEPVHSALTGRVSLWDTQARHDIAGRMLARAEGPPTSQTLYRRAPHLAGHGEPLPPLPRQRPKELSRIKTRRLRPSVHPQRKGLTFLGQWSPAAHFKPV